MVKMLTVALQGLLRYLSQWGKKKKDTQAPEQ